ncbi:MAG: L-erythro-3,5-diaminohexanoate dehydrogenase [Cyanobacteria bacterium NC_groundwater_1444_Ag_S-0.65um_54_12]|nr:L-erythro-3,5-diaminohexanoate dehydrogenase [Cyanobacteria bacterium NC_groundwater_1444_Ag_S-0.65um_54_12]
MSKGGCSPWGVHRSLAPTGVLPYAAQRLDPEPPLCTGEVLIQVDALNIDSASFQQLKAETGGDTALIAKRIASIVDERGKMHNPVTGSGGVLIGTVLAVAGRHFPVPGEKLVTLTSLTTTPLAISEISTVNCQTHQVKVRGHAILFERSPYAVLDGSLPEKLALSVLDVCGAPAQASRLVKSGQRILVVGAAGKSGLLISWVAAQAGARVIGLVRDEREAARFQRLPFAVEVLVADATDPLAVHQGISDLTAGALADLVFNCVNVPQAEMGCILACRKHGLVYFFSMATSFQAAALGAEAVGADVDLMIGNGFAQGHAALALALVRENPSLRTLLEEVIA